MDTNEPIATQPAVSETAQPPETQPFDEIALTLSGGGYRAAAFHLGTLDMLHRLDLLQSVHVLSTVSGGSLTGLKYTLSATESTPFEKFYTEFYDFLRTTNVIRAGLDGLQPPDGSPFSGQMPSLIRSAAQVYTSAQMLGTKTFGDILKDKSSHLREASFNATEFRTGNYFRFQKSASGGAVIGNRNLQVKREVAEMIRLADIAAASSCFPSAFEAFRFPDDFLWSNKLDEVRTLLGKRFTKCVPLMDGGIYDNQGVDSVLRAYDRANSQIGLLIISDTTQREPSLFEFRPEPKRGSLTVSVLVKLAWIVFFISVATAIVLAVAAIKSILDGGFHVVDIFLYVVPFILSSFLAASLWWIRQQFKEGQKQIAELTTVKLWPSLKNLTVPELADLISGRAKSLIALTSSIFLKRVRAMVYKDINVHPSYLNRQFANLIYDLDDTGKFRDEVIKTLQPEQFRDLAQRAEKVATSLWADDEELRDLVACGQVTTCFNIMRYILEKREHELNTPGSREQKIYENALAIWKTLKDNQYALLRN